MLELAKEVVETEKQVDPAEERDKAKEALTELFKEAKNRNTHIIVERIVADIDEIVKRSALMAGRLQPKGNASSRKNCAGVCSNTSCTQTRSCLIKPTATSSS